jgi:hypothetical protein
MTPVLSQPVIHPLTQDFYRIKFNHKLERARDGESFYILPEPPPSEAQWL